MRRADLSPSGRSAAKARPGDSPAEAAGAKGAGGESSLTTLPQSSFATVATRRRGDNRSRCRGRRPTHVDYDPFDPIRQGIERAAPRSARVRSSRTELPTRGRPRSEKTGEPAKTCGAFPQLGNAPHKFHFRQFHSVPRLLSRAPRQRDMLTKNRVLLAPSHRASPRSRSQHRRGRRLIYPPSGVAKERCFRPKRCTRREGHRDCRRRRRRNQVSPQ